MDTSLTDLIPLIGLYAETHYRFGFFPFSRYYRREPEVIFDTPHRLEPDLPLPVTLIVKDASRFPVTIKSASLKVYCKDDSVTLDIPLNTHIDTPFWHKIFYVNVSELPPGRMIVEASAVIYDGRRTLTIHHDNYAGLSHAPLHVHKAADPLPRLSGWIPGELHTHTEYGADQVEFGAPLEAIRSTADALGLGWAALTDHSYNLDDYEDDYLRDDPELTKWKKFRQHAESLNREGNNVVLIPGEELTCRSASGRNVHMLLLGEDSFLPGSGDGAQKWFRTRSELSVKEALNSASEDAFCAAAHPFAPVNLLERMLVKRGAWKHTDLCHPRLDGWQILNGGKDDNFSRSLKDWTAALLEGERKYIYAGNDSHGNFNRFRQVRLPMIALHEKHAHLFGRYTTHVRINGEPDAGSIIVALKGGRAVISSGPALELTILKNGREFHSGDELSTTSSEKIRCRYKTTTEFGEVMELNILTAGTNCEKYIHKYNEMTKRRINNSLNGEFALPFEGSKYIRAEARTRTAGGETHFAYSNPIWIK